MAANKNDLTPMQRQYFEIKEQNKDCVLFFRLGDFYEMFHDDAVLAAKELDLTLTTRDRNKPKEEQTPMCGVPFHAADSYIARLVSKGYKVAVCEQTSDPANAKGLVEREITRIVTPGSVTESIMLDESKNNYCACVLGLSPVPEPLYGLAFCDVSTGAFYVTTCDSPETVISELGRFAPREVIRHGALGHDPYLDDILEDRLQCIVDRGRNHDYSFVGCAKVVEEHFGKSLQELGIAQEDHAVMAAGVLLQSLYHWHKNQLAHIRHLEFYPISRFVELDLDARRNLELTETMRTKEKKGSLLGVLDKTHTPMGSRMLRSWLERPLQEPGEIIRRQDAVQELIQTAVYKDGLADALKQVTDLERVTARIVTGAVNPRELLALAGAMRALPLIRQELESMQSPMLHLLYQYVDTLKDLAKRIEDTLVEEPPVGIREGNLIRADANPEVARLRDIMNGGQDTILAIETAEREKTGIRTLKVSYNRVFGYYIEVSKSFMNQVPDYYIRKQTLANNERYITPELKELEEQVLTAKDRLIALEYELYTQLRQWLAERSYRIQGTAEAVAQIDALFSLATVAARRNYCRPEITDGNEIHIVDGRHPVVEQMQTDNLFVPNDTHLGAADNQVSIITGPNMAGKSTYMRQVALIVLMAQIGSFVPARSAKLCLVDRIFTRIGASDDLASGQSTFMVEMTEVASILKHATSRSLLILDEIGRGTSTYDGMSIARAVLEFAANPKQLGAKTLFATHYHELSTIEQELPNVKNYNIAVKKRNDQMIFLRKIVPGATDDSYGIEVAKLAGLPAQVIRRARDILQELEQQGFQAPCRPVAEPEDQISILDLKSQQVSDALQALNVETLTPIEAMNELYKLKKMLE